MRLGDPEIGEQLTNRVRDHRTTAIGMNGQLALPDILPHAGLGNQVLGLRGQLPVGHHPTHIVPAEDIQDLVQVVIGPRCRPFEIGDVP